MFSSSIKRALKSRWLVSLGSLAACLVLAVGALAAGQLGAVSDVLDRPARKVAPSRPYTITGVAHMNGRTVAVGPRGMIRFSDDDGATWRQAASPVAADLVTVRFAGPTTVWAVGHDSVALRSNDRGETWERMLDGRSVLQLLEASVGTSEALKNEIARTMEQSATPGVWPAPLLDIRFLADGQQGFAVGAFGLILYTRDGGRQWESWVSRADNPRRYHLYALAGQGNGVYIAGEQGLVLQLEPRKGQFERVETPYNGSYFGIDQIGSRLFAYGLRGNAFVSHDAGGQWAKIETGSDAHIVGTVAAGKNVYLVTQAGDVLLPDFAGGPTERIASAKGAEAYGAALVGDDKLALARFDGVRVIPIPAPGK